jgi:P-type Ca2+ transporter type 2C
VTVALSIATARMARRKVIVRRLAAVEGLGSCTFIASDKTGTLTVNRQTVRRIALPGGEHLSVTGEGYAGEGAVVSDTGDPLTPAVAALLAPVVRAGILCNEASLAQVDGRWEHTGDAVDVALLALGFKAGLPPVVVRADTRVEGEIPFESERAFAATWYVDADGRTRVAVKGALETLLPRCRAMHTAEGDVPVDARLLEQQAHDLSYSGHRFLLVAEGEQPAGPRPDRWTEEALPPLTVLGLVG